MNIFENVLNDIPTHENPEDYIGENGLMYCGVCNERKQTLVTIFGIERRMPVKCSCVKKEEQEFEAARKRNDFESMLRHKGGGLSSLAYKNYTFANNDGRSPNATIIAKRYADNFSMMKQSNTGLLIGGPVGTGKTFIAGCIANALLEEFTPVCMTSFPQVLNTLQNSKERNEFIEDLVSFDLLILDDLGVERSTDYGLEQLFNLVDARYKTNKPLIVTTNLSMKEMMRTENIALKRIYDRVLEMCAIPVLVDGTSRRQDTAKAKKEEAKKILGI